MKVDNLLEQLVNSNKSTIEFLFEDATELMQQYILYKRIEYILLIVLCLILIIGVPLLTRALIPKATKQHAEARYLGKYTEWDWDSTTLGVYTFISILCVSMGSIILIVESSRVIMLFTDGHLYIINQILNG